jgi:protein TonB
VTNAIVATRHDNPTPYVQKSAPRPAMADQSFSAAAIVGGERAPTYPDQYEDSQRAGRVTVDCVIQTDGRPTNCHVLKSSGGAAFEAAVNQWLNGSNPPRYRPAIRGGQPQAEEHQWVVSFQPPSE